MNSAFRDVDHKTRCGLRLDVMISVGNASGLDPPALSRRVASTLADVVAVRCPALMKGFSQIWTLVEEGRC